MADYTPRPMDIQLPPPPVPPPTTTLFNLSADGIDLVDSLYNQFGDDTVKDMDWAYTIDQVIIDGANALALQQVAAGDTALDFGDDPDYFQDCVYRMAQSVTGTHGGDAHYTFVIKALPNVGLTPDQFPFAFDQALAAHFDDMPLTYYQVIYAQFTDDSYSQFKRIQKMLRKRQYGGNSGMSKGQLQKMLKLLRGNDDLVVQMYATHLARDGHCPSRITLYTGDKFRDAKSNIRNSPPVLANGIQYDPQDYPDIPFTLKQVNTSHPTDGVCILPMHIQ